MKIKNCTYCKGPFDGNIPHLSCIPKDEKKQCQNTPYEDMNFSKLYIDMIITNCPSIPRTASIEWSEVTITSHPAQKHQCNQNISLLPKKKIIQQTLQDFWDNVTWITDENHCPNSVSIFYQDTETIRLINLSVDTRLVAKYLQTHPI